MPASTKRKAEDAKPSSRAAKSAKTSQVKGGQKATKLGMPASAFKAKARPLHVKLTDDVASDTASEGNTVGELTLNPSSFNTGSYGWKGSKRITVELDDAEGGEKTKVQVMLTINATVVGSKGTKDDAENDEAPNEEEGGNEAKEKEEAEGGAEAEDKAEE